MFKLIGACMIFFSAIYLSSIPLKQQSMRLNILRDFIHDFHCIQNELRTNLSTLPELMEFLSENGGKTTRDIYHELQQNIIAKGAAMFYTEWKKQLQRYYEYLNKEEIELLVHIGDILGKYGLEELLEELNHITECYNRAFHEEKIINRENIKLYLGVGTSFGLIFVILLI